MKTIHLPLTISALLILNSIGFSQSTATVSHDTIYSQNGESLSPLVSLVNMNVFYRGMNNPIEISIPGIYDQVLIECSGGTLTGENGKYKVKPGDGDKATISIFRIINGEIQDTTHFYFRIKPVPNPDITWGGRKTGEVIDGAVAALSPLVPMMENFEFDVYAMITSFDIKYSYADVKVNRKEIEGNIIPKDLAMHMNRLPSGTIVYFENIKISVPGGDERLSSAIFVIE